MVVAIKIVSEPKKASGVLANMTNFIGPSWSVSFLTSVQTVAVLVSPTNMNSLFEYQTDLMRTI